MSECDHLPAPRRPNTDVTVADDLLLCFEKNCACTCNLQYGTSSLPCIAACSPDLPAWCLSGPAADRLSGLPWQLVSSASDSLSQWPQWLESGAQEVDGPGGDVDSR
ncbi:hypothetical protein E2C01_014691 [Portunus trituberculatus]|uniref:Uncharacterized protein n=1 Tax=Portunus trituberculatus TaxID=210409 RepID=A0A5B7DJW6_PORTR|nr:hypothetical protein [Portunus trituberculatus]